MKKNGNKLSIALAACLLAVSVSACGGQGSTETTKAQAETAAATQASEAAKTGSEETTAAEETTEAPEEAAGDINAGTWNDNVYTNEAAGIVFTMPDGWMDILTDEIKGMETEGSTYLMAVMNTADGTNIQIMNEDLKTTASFLASAYTEETYLESLKSQLTQNDGSGTTVEIQGDVKEVQLGGQTYKYLSAKTTSGDTVMGQAYAVRKIGSNMLAIVFTSVDEITIDDYAGMFQ